MLVLGWLWAFVPTTLIGLLVCAVGGKPVRYQDGGWLWVARPWMQALMHRWGIGAITLGTVVLFQDWILKRPSIVRHELVHVGQAMRWGPLFYPAYLVGWALAGFRYADNSFEVAARAAETSVVGKGS